MMTDHSFSTRGRARSTTATRSWDLYRNSALVGTFDTFGAALDHAAPYDSIVLVNPDGSNAPVFSPTITVDHLTVQGDASLLGRFLLGTNAHTFTLAGTTNAEVDGGQNADTITGSDGSNLIIGGAGADMMIGRRGDDIYKVDTAADRIFETAGGGSDTVQSHVSFTLARGLSVETLTTDNKFEISAINLTGNELSNTLVGNAGDNILDGGAGADAMYGLRGNDTFRVDTIGDVVNEVLNDGSDRVVTSVSYALGAGQSIEALTPTSYNGTTNLNLAGNTLAQAITGNAGANTINDGGAGSPDTMSGLGGSDVYLVYNAGDVVNEAAGAGADRVNAAVSYALTAGQSVELLSPTSYGSTANINLGGNELAQSIIGNAGANVIDGKGGNDTLTGGGAGDRFLFDTALSASANVDRITDFAIGADIVELSHAIFTTLATGALPGNAFHIGPGAHDADDRIIYNGATGALTYDSNGNAAGGATQFATLSPGLSTLGAASFKVV